MAPCNNVAACFLCRKVTFQGFFRKTDCRSAADQQNAQHERLWCTLITTLCSQFRQPHGNLRVASRRFTPHPGRLSACLLTSSSGMLSTARLRRRAKKGVKGTRESTIACSESPTYLRGRLITASWGRSRNMQLLLKEKPSGKGASPYNLDSGAGFTLMSNSGYRRR